MNPRHFDLIVSGNGPVGCTLSLYLSRLFQSKDLKNLTKNSNFLILEKQKQDWAFPPNFPTRNFALTHSNTSFLESLLDEPTLDQFRLSGNHFRGMQIWKHNSPGIVQFGQQRGGYLSDLEVYCPFDRTLTPASKAPSVCSSTTPSCKRFSDQPLTRLESSSSSRVKSIKSLKQTKR